MGGGLGLLGPYLPPIVYENIRIMVIGVKSGFIGWLVPPHRFELVCIAKAYHYIMNIEYPWCASRYRGASIYNETHLLKNS